jgi:hypothetical protein
MQTTTLLTDEEINILKDLKEPEGITVKGLIIFGITLTLIAGIIGIFSVTDPFFLFLAGFFLVPGVILTIVGMNLRRKNTAYFNNPPYGNMKQVITDKLLRVELIDRKLLRYYFNGYFLDLYVASGQGYHPRGFRHKRVIDDAVTLTNVPVKLSFIEYAPGVNVLLDIRYNQYSFQESILPVEEADRKKCVAGNAAAFGCIIGMAVIITIILGFATSFSSDIFPMIVGFGAGPVLVIGLWVIIQGTLEVKHAKNKIVIRTVITEVIGLRVKNGKTTTRNTFYRLADGSLAHITHTPFLPGDNVLIQFMETRNGKKGLLIEMIRI